jgi:orotate phosphoribosyltransferase
VAESALPPDGVGRLADVLARAGALRFGDLRTRSGRPTPYFVDLGRVSAGRDLADLARCFADGVERVFLGPDGPGVDVLFGPAYKGIPLAVATGIELAARGHAVGVAFDRKEAKDHGEGGLVVGAVPRDGDRVLIVEDVTTAGTSVRAAVPLLRSLADVTVVGVLVAVDRRERADLDDPASPAALDALAAEFGFRAAALAGVGDLVARLDLGPDDRQRIADHLERVGPR